jgi:uncharacterized protein (DUF3084 family)
MDEDTGDNGLGGWAWFKLGQMAAEEDQSLAVTANRLNALFHPQPTIDVNVLVAENQQLWQQLQALQAEAQRLEAHNAELRGANRGLYKWYEWAKGAKQTLAKHKTEVAELRSANATLQQEYDAVVKLYDDLGHEYGKRFDRISDLEELVRKLRGGES